MSSTDRPIPRAPEDRPIGRSAETARSTAADDAARCPLPGSHPSATRKGTPDGRTDAEPPLRRRRDRLGRAHARRGRDRQPRHDPHPRPSRARRPRSPARSPRPAGTAAWIGAYVELLSFGLFLAFAVWACARLGDGILGQVARAAATAYTTLSIASLGLMDAITYRSRQGHRRPARRHARDGERGALRLHVVPRGLLPARGRPRSRWRQGGGRSGGARSPWRRSCSSGTAVSFDGAGQLAFMLWLAWIVYASIALARGEREHRTALTAAQHT